MPLVEASEGARLAGGRFALLASERELNADAPAAPQQDLLRRNFLNDLEIKLLFSKSSSCVEAFLLGRDFGETGGE